MLSILSRSFLRSNRAALTGVPAFLAAIFSLLPHSAVAQTMGDVLCSVAYNVEPFIDLFSWFAYVAGAYLIVQGLIQFKNHYENAGQNPWHKIMARFVGGSLLMVLPSTIGVLIDSIFYFSFGGGFAGSCGGLFGGLGGIGIGFGGVGGAVTLDALMVNFVSNIRDPLIFLLSIIAITMGVFFIVRGLVKAAHYGVDAKAHSITNILTHLIIGTIMVVIGQSLDMITASVFGGSGAILTFDTLSWRAIDSLGPDTTHFKIAIHAALTFFQLIGAIAFIRGWLIVKHAVEGVGQANYAQGFTHIIGGVLCINIYLFLRIMDATFGTGFVT